MKESCLETEYAEFWIHNGIVCCAIRPSVKKITLEIATTLVKERLKSFNNQSYPLLTDLGNMLSVEREARVYLGEGDALKFVNSVAILTSNHLAKLAANVYLRVNKPHHIPMRYFSNENEALNWLVKHKTPEKIK